MIRNLLVLATGVCVAEMRHQHRAGGAAQRMVLIFEDHPWQVRSS